MRDVITVLRVAAAAATLAAVAACAKTAQPVVATSGGALASSAVAYVDMEKVVAAHPMHSQVSALQDQINALNSEALVAPQAATPEQQQAQAQLQQQLQAAEANFQNELGQKRAYYLQKESEAVASVQSKALGRSTTSPGGMIAGMQQQYGGQLKEMQSAAGKTLLDYRNALFKEDADHLRRVQQQLSFGVTARVRAKSQQQSDAETAYAVQLAKQDQSTRLNLRAKLENLALSDKERAQAQSQLNDIETREAYLINQMKRNDEADLKRYIAAQNTEAAAKFAAERNATQTATNAKLQERQKQLGTQMQQQIQTIGGQFNQQIAAANQSLAKNPKVQADLSRIHSQFQSEYMADADRALQSYQESRKALVERYSSIAHMQFQDSQTIQAQIQSLASQRRDLYSKIVDQVTAIVAQIARKEGYAVVFTSVRGASGAMDLTDQVAHAVAGLPSATAAPNASPKSGG